jgi:L-threonylcarbamoyladenylate synthase
MNIGANIDIAAKIIREGGLVAFPTETVYGLGADALNPIAVAKIFEAKQRPTFDPLIVHIHCYDQINSLFASPISPWVQKLAEAFWPGPLTIVHKKSSIVPHIVTSGLETVGVRMPSHLTAIALLHAANCPIAAPSANKFGQISPTEAAHVIKQLHDIDYVLEGEKVTLGIESTVVSVAEEGCYILRPGVITAEDLQKVVPLCSHNPNEKIGSLSSPGLLNSHYAPTKPMYLITEDDFHFPANAGLILHSTKKTYGNSSKTFYTSQSGDKKEIASTLFSAFHTMEDEKDIQQIFIEPVEEIGIGIAIMDRIKKAVFKYNTSQ